MENPRSATATPPYFLATTSLATPSVSASFQVRLIEPNPSWLYVANTATTIALPSATITNTAVVCISLLRAFSLLFLIGVQSLDLYMSLECSLICLLLLSVYLIDSD